LAGSCEYGNEPSGFIKSVVFILSRLVLASHLLASSSERHSVRISSILNEALYDFLKFLQGNSGGSAIK
jgi:hypothetical protein